MGNGQTIIDKILADANQEALVLINKAEKEAENILFTGKTKADKEEAQMLAVAKSEAEKIAAKQISSAQMEAKKMILTQKQELISQVIKEAKQKLLSLNETEYKVILIGMLVKAEVEEKSQIILSNKDRDIYGEEFSSMGYYVSDETREIEGGFVVKKGDIEYNYSFDSILSVKKDEIEQLTAQILF